MYRFPFPSCYWQMYLVIDDAIFNGLFTVTIMPLIWVDFWVHSFVCADSVRMEGTRAMSEMQNDISDWASICM